MRLSSCCLLLSAAFVALFSFSACEYGSSHAGVSPVSGALQITEDDRLLVLAAEDHDAVLVMSRDSGEVLHQVSVSKAPSQLIVRNGTAVVTTRYGHRIEVIDLESGRLRHSIPVGVEPYGLTFVDENRVAVALSGEQALAIVNLDDESVEAKIPLSVADPRAVAKTEDGKLWVTHMSEGVMSVVSLHSNQTKLMSIETAVPQTMLEPEHLRSLTLSPDGKSLLMAHSQANTLPVRVAFGDEALFTEEALDGNQAGDVVDDGDTDAFEDDVDFGEPVGDSTQCGGYDGCPEELPAVVPALTEVDVQAGIVVTPGPTPSTSPTPSGFGAFTPSDEAPTAAEKRAPVTPGILNPNDNRFSPVSMNNPTAMALFAGGKGLAVLQMGSRNVLFLRRELTGSVEDIWGTANVGHGASSLAIRHDGRELFVWNQFDGTITSLKLSDMELGGEEISRFSTSGTQDKGHWLSPVAKTWQVLEDALPPDVSLGRKLFHDALDTRISANGTISCATCHPDGRTDGRTWNFTFGPRNTPQLGGGILSTAPFHWPGDVENVRALNHMTVQAFMGGAGLDDGSMDALGAYIDQIPSAPTRSSMLATQSASVARGQEIFESVETGCTACHSGLHFTDNVAWNIGSTALLPGMLDIERFQTPVLHGLARSAPYFHDGSLPSLELLVEEWVRSDRMGTGSHLSDEEVEDLVSYLKTL